jgi:exosortase A-associated hydrolase 2
LARGTHAFFLDTDGGSRFCLHHTAPGTPRGAVLFVHAFAEEMHKSRRMVALQARALCAAGFDVLQIDLKGCGDSSGNFGDASWDDWLTDVQSGCVALTARSPAPLWLWGHRTGALLACEIVARSTVPARLLLWHPVASGAQFLNQFLRIRLIAQGEGGAEREDTRSLRATLAAGRALEVGGYMLSPALSTGLDRSTLQAPPPGSRVCWLDVVHAPDAPAPATSYRLAQAWARQGVDLSHQAVPGVPFWQTQEISECEALIAQSLESMLD